MDLSALLRRGVAAVALAAGATTAQAQGGGWNYTLTPYLWLPNVNGTAVHSAPPGSSGGPSIEVGPYDYLESLKAVLMLAGEARNGPWALFGDVIYLKFASEESRVKSVDFVNIGSNPIGSSVDLGTTTTIKGWAAALGASRTVIATPQGTFDVLGGVRYLDVEAASDWRLSLAINGPGGAVFPASGRVATRTTLWDGIVGVRGRAQLGSGAWSVPYYVDVGAGSSDLTWQAMVGVSYRFGWGDLTLAYRHLYYDQNSGELLQDFEFSGPALGAAFRF